MDDQSLTLFHTEEGKPSIEDYAFDNGMHFWYASDVATILEYEDFALFKKDVMNKAIGVCMTTGFSVLEHFEQCKREKNGHIIDDWKLSRFAFFLTAMNGSLVKPQVQLAQAYFAAFADSAAQIISDQEAGERLLIRDEVKKGERTLGSVVKTRGIQNYGLFHNAGYMGMYNMSFNQLRDHKGIPGNRSPLDFMGQRELAANLFRLTETSERIKSGKAYGDNALQGTAKQVGSEVREFMLRGGGTPPEQLPAQKDIETLRKSLKSTSKELKQFDAPKERTSPKKKKNS
jgi:DNA-damage-inducible protein D